MNFQVTIVGGGVAGALLALYLGKARVNTCLIDKGQPSVKLLNPFFGRTTSLNLASINSLREAGVWETIEKNAQQFDEIYVWDAEGSSSVQFNAAEISRKDLGVIVHNNIILEAIFNELERTPEVKLIEEILGVPPMVGTVAFGSPYVGAGLAASNNGVIAGRETTGPELNRIEDALGLI
mgnify:CR=1 FL=1